MRTALRRILSRQVSVDSVIEFGMWLAIPYVLAGLLWAFFHAEQVQHVDAMLASRMPAGSEIAAFGQVAVMWPVLLITPDVCVL